eukprot:CAMPEP_0116845808 /NCGR_PEP_ID=MMETSP0418-20121206/13486_1 /TAXON_ID=1158023 /ORGANISM="Astrosyne radiata, Strain 13vi08-1A" /LENGTH=102 /DNA_ID=CAMNT_0004476987 /DNA_START=561 /DNA_END=869 /DNA_ORIENTATION=-
MASACVRMGPSPNRKTVVYLSMCCSLEEGRGGLCNSDTHSCRSQSILEWVRARSNGASSRPDDPHNLNQSRNPPDTVHMAGYLNSLQCRRSTPGEEKVSLDV